MCSSDLHAGAGRAVDDDGNFDAGGYVMGSFKNGESQSARTELAFRCKSCELIAGGIMAKNPRYYHTAVHKNITRDRFIRSVNPIVAEKMRAILEELKRKESGRG